MYRLVPIVLALVLVLGLFGCGFPIKDDINSSNLKNGTKKSEEINTVIDSLNYEKDITDIIKKNTEKDFGTDDLFIKEIITNENNTFVIFIIKKANTWHEGLAFIEKEQGFYKLNEIDIAKIDLNVPFTKHTLNVLLKDGRYCRILGGYINNKNIKKIHLEYKNNTVNVIKIGPNQNTYMDYTIGHIDAVKEIVGFNRNNVAVYSYR